MNFETLQWKDMITIGLAALGAGLGRHEYLERLEPTARSIGRQTDLCNRSRRPKTNHAQHRRHQLEQLPDDH
jgi:hypothetical protein